MDSPFYRNTDNYEWIFDPKTGAPSLGVKSDDKTRTTVKYVQDAAGNWVPDYNSASQSSWETNNNDDFYKGVGTVLGAAVGGNLAAGSGALGQAAQGAWTSGLTAAQQAAMASLGLGSAAGASGVTTSALPAGEFSVLPNAITEATMAGGTGAIPGTAGASWGIIDPALASIPSGTSWASAVPNFTSAAQLAPYMSSLPAAIDPYMAGAAGTAAGSPSMAPPASTGTGLKMPTNFQDWMKFLSGAGGLTNLQDSKSPTGSLLGGLLGAGLGYLDARNQPDEITIKNQIDPNLSAAWYDKDTGLVPQAQGLLGSLKNQPSPLTTAGQKINKLADTPLPTYNDAVKNNQSLFDYNPFVNQQSQAITDLLTRNLKENVFKQEDTNANIAGGYGGTKNALALGTAASRMNQDLAPTLAQLGSNAYENSQNRALQGASTQLNYGLADRNQTANLYGTGAMLEANGPWNNYMNMSSLLKGAPGSNSVTTPLFNNPLSSAIGGASTSAQIGGGTDWSEWLKNIGTGIGGIGDFFKKWTG
jgi:hypothetical protein